MASIFISYRREDSGGHAGRLCDRLSARFGDDRVFMDLQDIAPGQDFPRSIDETIASCDCVIAVIGPRWLEAMQKRAGAAEDFVHHEISAALLRNITVIPVLVGGARMPSAGQLPPALNPLRHRNAFELHDMLGNVSEWVLDRYYSNVYADPVVSAEVEEPLAGNASGVARGGSWLSAGDGVRVSRRLEMPPHAEEPHVGFRCAVDRL